MLEKEMSLEDREEVKMTSTFLRGFASAGGYVQILSALGYADSFVKTGSRLSCIR